VGGREGKQRGDFPIFWQSVNAHANFALADNGEFLYYSTMLKIMDVSTSGLISQRIRMTAIASNLANITSTRNENGELKPYEPRFVKFQEDNTIGPNGSAGVFVREIARDELPPIRKYVPFHPDADEQGFINLPRINLVTEFTDAIESGRSYEANLGAMDITKSMANQSLRIIT